jgi:uncharacterized protein (DUF2345 family)
MSAANLPVQVVNFSDQNETLLVRGPNVELEITQRGSVVELSVSRGDLRLVVPQTLSIEAKQIDLVSDGDLSLRAGGEIRLESAFETKVQAHSVGIRAKLGDVKIDANDDVRLEGERIRMNS